MILRVLLQLQITRSWATSLHIHGLGDKSPINITELITYSGLKKFLSLATVIFTETGKNELLQVIWSTFKYGGERDKGGFDVHEFNF